MRNGWQNIFDSFYTRFVLRDFFGKIVPGGILLSAIAVSVMSPASVIKYIASMSFWAWIVALGVSWLTAFAIQSFAEKPLPKKLLPKGCDFSLIRYYPRGRNQKESYDLRFYFHQKASPDEKRQAERFVVIKEACGNGYVAIAISLVLVMVDAIRDKDSVLSFVAPAPSNLWVVVPVLILAIAAIYYLCQMHFFHVKREYNYMVRSLELHKSEFASSFSWVDD